MSDCGSDNENLGYVVTPFTTKEELFNELAKASTKEELKKITNDLAAQMDAIRNERRFEDFGKLAIMENDLQELAFGLLKAMQSKEDLKTMFEKFNSNGMTREEQLKAEENAMRRRKDEEKLYPHLAALRAHRERKAIELKGTNDEVVLNNYHNAMTEGRLNPVMAVVIKTLMVGKERERKALAWNLSMSQFDAVITDNNLDFLDKLDNSPNGKSLGMAYGKNIVKLKVPLLWEDVRGADALNITLMTTDPELATTTTLSGSGPFSKSENQFGRNSYIMPKNVFETLKKHNLLSGSGYSVRVNPDGMVVLDDMEMAYNTLNNAVQSLGARVAEFELGASGFSNQLQLLHQQQQTQQQQMQAWQTQVPSHNYGGRAPSPRMGNCYNCGKPGHIARNCYARSGGGGGNGNGNNNGGYGNYGQGSGSNNNNNNNGGGGDGGANNNNSQNRRSSSQGSRKN